MRAYFDELCASFRVGARSARLLSEQRCNSVHRVSGCKYRLEDQVCSYLGERRKEDGKQGSMYCARKRTSVKAVVPMATPATPAP